MKKERITVSGYKYAPETFTANVNGIKVDIENTNIAMDFIAGNTEKATADLKRLYRKMMNQENKYIYVFFEKGTKRFHYIAVLSFKASADLKERLYNYKELKHHLQNNPIAIQTESGNFNPYGVNKATENKIDYVEIDFSKCRTLRIA